jgi:hypothetical protein
VPKEEALLEQHEIQWRLFRDSLKSKGLSMKPADDGKGSLTMIPNSDTVAIVKFKIGLVPFEHISPSFAFAKVDLWAEKLDLESGKMVLVAFNCVDSSGVVQDLIVESALLIGNELPANASHGKRGGEVSQ